ncbi:ParA family protein [Corynebacterium vitaeruminis]|uniref:ParA family protein n=1 Tax=Corynebacterium vitaeruminis TaxID=38305 RepID=UPI0005561720|nr:ParA family protein [Corynebacterium vitaeruminis]
MPIIALCNLKGGTGKTTSAIYLATALARQDKPVVVLDADPQGSATEWAQQAEDSGMPLDFEVLPANARSITRVKAAPGEWIIIDCPPGESGIIDAAIQTADHVIIPTRPSSIEVNRMWSTTDLATATPTTVLLTSVIPNTNSQQELREALAEEGIPTFKIGIPQREAIKKTFGQVPGKLHGYDTILAEIEKKTN